MKALWSFEKSTATCPVVRRHMQKTWILSITSVRTSGVALCHPSLFGRLQLKCGDARVGKWRGNWRMEWVASTLHTTSEHGVSCITTADAHTSAGSSRLNWRPPGRFRWTRPFRLKTKSGLCACAVTFQLAYTAQITIHCQFLPVYQKHSSLRYAQTSSYDGQGCPYDMQIAICCKYKTERTVISRFACFSFLKLQHTVILTQKANMPHEEQALLVLVQRLQFIVLPHKQNIDNSKHDSSAWQFVTSCCTKAKRVQWTHITHSSGTTVWEHDTDRWISITLRPKKMSDGWR